MGKECDTFVFYLKEKLVANSTFEVYNSPGGDTSTAATLFGLQSLIVSLIALAIGAVNV